MARARAWRESREEVKRKGLWRDERNTGTRLGSLTMERIICPEYNTNFKETYIIGTALNGREK